MDLFLDGTEFEMKNMKKIGIALAFAGSTIASQAATLSTLNSNGNQDGWTVVAGYNGGELGMRAKVRYPGGTDDTGTVVGNKYTFDVVNDYAAEYAATPANRSMWNFEFSLNLGAGIANPAGGIFDMNDLTYNITIGTSPGNATTYAFDFINTGGDPARPGGGFDHYLANTSTPTTAIDFYKAGNDAAYTTALNSARVAQNSWNLGFFTTLGGPVANGEYTVSIDIKQAGNIIGSNSIVISQVPEPTTGLMSVVCLGGFLLRRRRA